jgi:hypothetical protein
MRLAARDAPVAVKSRAVEPVNKVKIIPVEIQLTYQSGGTYNTGMTLVCILKQNTQP